MYQLNVEAKEVLHDKLNKTSKEGRELCPGGINAVTAVQIFHHDMVSRLFKKGSEKDMLVHGVMGISGEAGELLDAIKKHVYYDRPLDTENVVEELGDILFYVQAVAQRLGVSIADLMAHNACKLQLNDNARYKTGSFSNEQANERADKAEENFVGTPIMGSRHLEK